MKCPKCGARDWDSVIRTLTKDERVRRVRECGRCHGRFKTDEIPVGGLCTITLPLDECRNLRAALKMQKPRK